MLAIILKGLWSHKRRLTGTFLAVLLGVAFLSGTLVLGDTLRANFDTLFTSVTGDTGAVVRNATKVDSNPAAPRGPIDASLVERLRSTPGAAEVLPVVTGLGQIVGKDGKVLSTMGPPRAGNWITDPSLTPYRLAEGRAPQAPDEVVVNRGAAKDGGLRVGDRTAIVAPQRVPVTVVGIVTFQDADAFGGSSYVGFSLDGARQHLTNRPGEVTSILVKAAAGVSQQELVQELRPLLPAGVEAITGKQLSHESITDINQGFLGVFRTFLLVFAGIALFVAMFSIANTFSIIVAQRTRESALLRAIGASRRQVLSSVVVEALAVGLVASVVGLGGGIGVATGLKALFAGFGFPLPTSGLVVKASSAALSVAVGIGVTLLAGVLPALRASRVAPLAAMRAVAAEPPAASRARGVTGAVLTGAGVAATLGAVLAGGGATAQLTGVAAVLTMVGMVVLGPVVARPASRLIGAPLRRLRGITGSLARQNAMRNPRRTAGAAVALMIGVAVVALFTVFTASVQASIQQTVSRSFGGDLAITSSGFTGGRLDPRLADAVARLPEVRQAAGIGTRKALVGGSSQEVTVADPARLDGVVDLQMAAGSIGELAGQQLAVAKSVADDKGWRVGSAVPVRFADGATETFTLGAIYNSQDAVVGNYLLPRAQWPPHATDVDSTVLIALRPGTDLDAGRAAVERVAGAYGNPDVQDRAQYADTLTSAIDPIMTIVYVMLMLAIVIALMGIANTMSLSIHERTRELGLLRAVGETRGQVRAMVRWESVVVALFGTAGGLGLGVFLGWALVRAAAGDGTTAFAAPLGQLAVILLVGALAGVLAGLRPARRAARLNVLAAIASE
ncbi:MAG TPA: FtsX-like permease family protein [Actinomycetes bacterium]|jgi:putative ABC transport system permease protein|nr:FtsX-like permease family protein [Actinomycetes bacterium]